MSLFSTQSDPSDPESHKNEGFLKSMWHNLTNHPAHEKAGETNSSSTSDKPTNSKTKNDAKSKKPDEEPKEPKKPDSVSS